MLDFPTAIAGVVTIGLLVGLGIFIYPWLLKRPAGVTVIGALTVLLSFLFYTFDRSNDVSALVSAALGVLWACAPVVAGVIVWRIGRKAAPREPDAP